MTTTLPRPLHSLGHQELDRAARDRRWPKWATMAVLHSVGLPTLNATLLRPGQTPTEIRTAARALAAALDTDRLMIRSDGGVERKQYYRGGNTFPVADIAQRAAPLLDAGRAVILAGPTNRFTNKLTVMVRMDRPGPGRPGTFTLEGLGPGYDVADLTRGELPRRSPPSSTMSTGTPSAPPAGTSGPSPATGAPAAKTPADGAAWSASPPRPSATAASSPERPAPRTPKPGSAAAGSSTSSAPRAPSQP
ncbi:hypothetical protein [Streptomyces sp. SPB4]|uniref:hypothetical protein n=1 Tax=Streptomyces sp. SPB4 TaxID=2940553 RepID=UPI002477293E|nr:hypothetical protein [Streptomyces sp. SPB4]MDH6537975.1 hypothetical protein [Streptomyces sp. SPB4]